MGQSPGSTGSTPQPGANCTGPGLSLALMTLDAEQLREQLRVMTESRERSQQEVWVIVGSGLGLGLVPIAREEPSGW